MLRGLPEEATCDYCGCRLGRTERVTRWKCGMSRSGRALLCGHCATELKAAALIWE